MAKRCALSHDPPNLDDLVSACIVLDDWLHWMPEICGSVQESGLSRDDQSFLCPYRFLTHLAANRLWDGMEYLLRQWPRVLLAVDRWTPLLTRDDGQLPIQSVPLTWRPVEENVRSGWLHLFPLSNELAFPTAHEAVRDCFDRFMLLVKQIGLCPASVLNELALRTNHSALQWHRDEASCLLACMDQERRWLSRRLGRAFGPPDDYRDKWRPYTSNTLSLGDQVQQLSETKLNVLQALLQEEPQTQDRLSETANGSDSPSGAFKAVLRQLCRDNLIHPGEQGRGSEGYILTPLGNALALLFARARRPSQ